MHSGQNSSFFFFLNLLRIHVFTHFFFKCLHDAQGYVDHELGTTDSDSFRWKWKCEEGEVNLAILEPGRHRTNHFFQVLLIWTHRKVSPWIPLAPPLLTSPQHTLMLAHPRTHTYTHTSSLAPRLGPCPLGTRLLEEGKEKILFG